MRILYLSHYFPPEFGAAAARAYSTSRWLVSFGHDVTVLTGFPNYLVGNIPERYRGKKWVREEMDGVKVYRTWLYTSPQRSNWRRLANYISFMVSSWWHGRKLQGTFDVIITSSPPLFTGLAGAMLARRFGIPFALDVRDIWPETAVDVGAFKAGSLMERIWSRLAGFIYARAFVVLAVTDGIKIRLQDRGVPAKKVHLVPNGVDLDFVKLGDPNLRPSLQLEEKFVVLFAGLIGVMQDVSSIVEAADLLRNHAKIHFVIVGDGVMRESVANQIKTFQLENVSLLPRQPGEAMPAFLNMADVCLVTLAYNVRGTIPYKLLEAWSYKKPVIAAVRDDGAELVHTCDGGLVVSCSEPTVLAGAILALKDDREMARRFGENGRRCIERRLNRKMLARQMEAILESCLEDQHRASAGDGRK
ncbi:MAG: glycosyltransferase family 4 protein [Chloroflexi bacterium]|nr:glycosyltransferase family 4 protein [Chloroflexota bacterium]